MLQGRKRAPSAATLNEVVPTAPRPCLGLNFAAWLTSFWAGVREALRELSVNGVTASQHVSYSLPCPYTQFMTFMPCCPTLKESLNKRLFSGLTLWSHRL